MKRILGLLAMLLGGVGVVLLVAGGVAAWRVAGVVVDRTDRAAARGSGRLVNVEGRLTRLEGRVKDLTVDVEVVRSAGARLAGKLVGEAIARTDFEPLLDRLDRSLSKAEEWGETLDVITRLVEDVADLSAQFDGAPERAEQLRRVAAALDEAAAVLAGVRAELADFRTRNAAPDPRKLADLAARTRAPLERLAGGIAAVRQHSADARGELEAFRGNVHFWSRAVATAMSVVVVWLGLGQVCLVGWGWKRVRLSPRRASAPGAAG
ncbi:MAG: hypothetical protein U0804_13340 [Gemmataceae bacterium]